MRLLQIRVIDAVGGGHCPAATYLGEDTSYHMKSKVLIAFIMRLMLTDEKRYKGNK